MQRRDGRQDRRPRLGEGEVGVRDLVVGGGHGHNLFPRACAARLGSVSVPAVVDVPLNTSLADLDEALRTLLRRELERHGFEGVEIAFDAPASDWSAKLDRATVNLFLYDLRENLGPVRGQPARRARQRREHVGAAADAPRGHLRRHRVDEGGRRTSTACSHRCCRSSSPHLAARRPAHGPARPGASQFRSIETEVGRPKRRRQTSGRRSAAATRRRSTTRSGSRSSPA